ncbi:urease accessory protein UreD [Azohydromonas caseinilytica]|uniref:Urease accessory protein UreD n=1 Tax=Azohydromonas caseinilytica TaxID=2728836 RepID=A0A848FG45_9BURK|nr:urease accessory protein UreD [Azohydromonas caseinilytica]NML18418.1 urease accessory protein UreD [Azohydromonas caseinilytica]
MAWHAELSIRYFPDRDRTVALDRHEGPLRVLQRLYPEGPRVCHHVLVHPPGGVAGGDELHVKLQLEAGSHALLTTPGATRFYRSLGETALQSVRATLQGDARLEWLPLEAIAHDACRAENRQRFELRDQAQMIGWDVIALGLPAAGDPWRRGRFLQHLELPGVWLERGLIDAADIRLLDSPLGWAGSRVLATLWFASAQPLPASLREALLEAGRALCEGELRAGVTSPSPRVVVLRMLAARVEPAQRLMQALWARWREVGWNLPACAPRVWGT